MRKPTNLIFQPLAIDDLPGGDSQPDQFHNLSARGLGRPQPIGKGGRDGRAAGQAHAHRFGQAAHRVGRAQERTGAAGRFGFVLQHAVGRLVNLAGFQHAQRFGQ
jgi:hypothetical protein